MQLYRMTHLCHVRNATRRSIHVGPHMRNVPYAQVPGSISFPCPNVPILKFANPVSLKFRFASRRSVCRYQPDSAPITELYPTRNCFSYNCMQTGTRRLGRRNSKLNFHLYKLQITIVQCYTGISEEYIMVRDSIVQT